MKCYSCGIEIMPSSHNLCHRCIALKIDITEGFRTEDFIEWCKKCERYFLPPNGWEFFEWNSVELLAMMLSRNHELKTVKLIDSRFIFTEEHSKKIIIEIEIEKIIDGFPIRKSFRINYKRRNKQCPDCENIEAKKYWNALVQLRQRPHSKRVFLYLEQMILNNKMFAATSNIKEKKDGMDFFYLNKIKAKQMVHFIERHIGCRTIESSKLVSLDMKSNIAKNRDTFSVEILPFCKDDLIFIDRKLAVQKSCQQYLLVTKVSRNIETIDILTGKIVIFLGSFYWSKKNLFTTLFTSKNLQEYQIVEMEDKRIVGNYQLANIYVTRDYETIYHAKTHIANMLTDSVLGYDIEHSNIQQVEEIPFKFIPVRKALRITDCHIQTESKRDIEYEFFIDDIINDRELRSGINLYDKKNELIENFEMLQL